MRMDRTAIMVVLDRSGSMASISDDVRGGFDAFVAEQRKEPGEATLTLVQFDTAYEVVYINRPLAEVPPLVHVPRGSTALLDALGRGIVELGEALAKVDEADRPGRVIVVVMTDGHENASREYSRERIAAMVKEQRETYSWEFVFTGANVDAFAEARGLGIAHAAGYAATSKGVADNLRGVSRGVSSYRSGGGYQS